MPFCLDVRSGGKSTYLYLTKDKIRIFRCRPFVQWYHSHSTLYIYIKVNNNNNNNNNKSDNLKISRRETNQDVEKRSDDNGAISTHIGICNKGSY